MRKHLNGRGGLVVLLTNLLMYMLNLASFMILMSRTTKALTNLSRTAAIVLVSYTMLYWTLRKAFGVGAIGRERRGAIIYSASLTVLLTDLFVYFEMMIMRVNGVTRTTLNVRESEVVLLCLSYAAQLALIFALVYLGSAIYYRLNPPQRCCLVAPSHASVGPLMEKMRKYRRNYTVVSIVDYRRSDVRAVIAAHDAVFLYDLPPAERIALMEYAYHMNRDVYFASGIGDILTRYSRVTVLDDMPFMEVSCERMSLEQRLFKRAMDVLLSAAGLIVLSPLMLGCALAIRLCDGGPVFYRQDRVTGGDRVFSIYKFRSMYVDGAHVPQVQRSARVDDDRITPVGRFLRKYRLDELPQLINILKGEMSLVGPRPEMVDNVRRYLGELPEFTYRTRMKAGLTGYAQIEGKYNTSPKDKLIMDLMYIEDFSLWLDIKLLLYTVRVFFRKDSTEGFRAEGAPKPPADETNDSAAGQ